MISKQVAARRRRSAVLAFGVAACGDDGGDSTSSGGGSASDLSGSITIDGSSTVQPFAEAAAELFNQDNPDVKITVGDAGTGGGLREVLRRRDRHLRRLAADRARGGRRLQEGRRLLQRVPGRQRRDLGRHQPGSGDQLPDDRPAEAAVDRRLGHQLQPARRRRRHRRAAARRRGQPLRARAPTRARSTTSPTRSTVRRTCSRKDYQPSEDDNVLVAGRRRRPERARLLRVLLLRAEPGQAEPGLGRRRQRLRRPEHRDDPGRRRTRRSRVRCSCTRPTEALQQPGGRGVHAVRRRQLRRDRRVGADRPDGRPAGAARRSRHVEKAVG